MVPKRRGHLVVVAHDHVDRQLGLERPLNAGNDLGLWPGCVSQVPQHSQRVTLHLLSVDHCPAQSAQRLAAPPVKPSLNRTAESAEVTHMNISNHS
jgi:hypothetical protein